MTITYQSTLALQGVARLLHQFRGKENIEALLTAFLDEVQAIETALVDCLLLRTITDAEGEQLDLIGRVIGLERNGLDDEKYRLNLIARVAINIGSGTPEELLRLASLLTYGEECRVVERAPAGVAIICDARVDEGDTVATMLHQAKPAGVRSVFEWHETDPVFKFDQGISSMYGFGGGHWANGRTGGEQ